MIDPKPQFPKPEEVPPLEEENLNDSWTQENLSSDEDDNGDSSDLGDLDIEAEDSWAATLNRVGKLFK